MENKIPLGSIEESDTLGITLHHAALHGSKKALRKVVDKGMHVDYPNDEGQTPLFLACHGQQEAAVEYLLSAGANPNERSNNGLTPVHVACYAGNVKIITKLLEKGGDLRLHDNDGRTVKDWARNQPDPKKRGKILGFLENARLFAMSSSGRDLMLGRASSSQLQKIHSRTNSITKMIREKVGRHTSGTKFEQMAASHHSLGFGQVYADGEGTSGFTSSIPLVSEVSLRHDADGETYNNGSFYVMESMWWDYSKVTVKRMHRDIDSYQGGMVDFLINELEHIGKLRHPNILLLMGVCQTNNLDGMVLIFERIGKGSLHNLLHQKLEKLPTPTIHNIARQLCSAIIFLHTKDMVHCNITSHAVNVVTDHIFKLGNFEYMTESSKSETGRKNAVVLNTHSYAVYNWLAPEVMFNMPASYYGDMYGFCSVLWELLHSEIPWELLDWYGIKEKYSQGEKLLKKGSKVSELYRVILEYGLQLDPNHRQLSFLHVRDLLRDSPKDPKQFIKTHFQHITPLENTPKSGVLYKLDDAEKRAKKSRREKQRKQTSIKSDEQQAMSRQVAGRNNNNNFQSKGTAYYSWELDSLDNFSIPQNTEPVYEPKQVDYSVGSEAKETKKARHQKSKSHRSLSDGYSEDSDKHEQRYSPKPDHSERPFRSVGPVGNDPLSQMQFQNQHLELEVEPHYVGEDEYAYNVIVRKSPPRKPIKFIEKSNQDKSCEVDAKKFSTESTEESDTSESHGHPVRRKTSPISKFSYLSLNQRIERPSVGRRVAGVGGVSVKPAGHSTAPHNESQTTEGQLTSTGSLYAIYNDFNPAIKYGLTGRSPTLMRKPTREQLNELVKKQPSAPPRVEAERNWFEGRGSVRDLAVLFDHHYAEREFRQGVLEGKFARSSSEGSESDSKQDKTKKKLYPPIDKSKCIDTSAGLTQRKVVSGSKSPRDTATEKLDANKPCPALTKFKEASRESKKLNASQDLDVESSASLTTVSPSENGDTESRPSSEMISDWVDKEMMRISSCCIGNLDFSDIDMGEEDTSKKADEMPTSSYKICPGESILSVTEDSSDNNPLEQPSPMQSVSKQQKKDADVEEFYFDDVINPNIGKEAHMRLSESYENLHEEKARNKAKSNTVGTKRVRLEKKKKGSRIPRAKDKVSPAKSLKSVEDSEVAYQNKVTVRSSLDEPGKHQLIHTMTDLSTGKTQTLKETAVQAGKVTTTVTTEQSP